MSNLKNFNSKGLLKPQIEHSKFLIESLINNNIAWDASPTGSGKTYVGASIVRYLKRNFVVICPKLNIPKWYGVLNDFGVKPLFVLNYEKIARGNLKKIYRYKVRGQKGIPYFLRGEFRIPKDCIVILDESHRTKGVESLQSGMLYTLKNQGYTVLCISATQAMTPLDLRSFGYATGLHKGMNTVGGKGENFGMNIFKQFCISAGAKFVGKWGAMYFDSNDKESVEKLQSVRDELFNVRKIASRMDRKDFGDIFPHNQIECESYDMGENGKKIRVVYEDMQRELIKLEERCENYSHHILAIITKARRKAELLKVPTFIEMTEDLIDEGKSVVIFVNYTDTIEVLFQRLSKKYGSDMIGMIYGGQTVNQRLNDIEMFQSDKKRIILANLAAGGEAIDLQDTTGKYPRASLINPSYRSISVIQSIGRIDRAYTKSDCLTRFVLASGTIEDEVGDNFNRKKDHLDILQDGDLVPNGIKFHTTSVAGMDI